jgi:uncharacterized membrane protein
MEWLLFCVAFVTYILACWLTYHKDYQAHWSYLWVGAALSYIWYQSAVLMGDKQRIYFYSLCWDIMMVGIYYFMPILFFGVKLDWRAWVGTALITAGVLIFKVGGHE